MQKYIALIHLTRWPYLRFYMERPESDRFVLSICVAGEVGVTQCFLSSQSLARVVTQELFDDIQC